MFKLQVDIPCDSHAWKYEALTTMGIEGRMKGLLSGFAHEGKKGCHKE